jgi:hypothetical protein
MAGKAWLLRGAALGTTALLTACGGSGGGNVSSTPPPPTVVVAPPAPAPTPTPTPSPTSTPAATTSASFDTNEYRATVGAVSMNALAAYNAGATGKGVGIAIIDTGIDLQSPEFEGRISAASTPVAGQASVADEDGHGTAVAFIAAGRRNGANTHGVAFEASVIALRGDRSGSCATTGDNAGCKFGTDSIAAGVDAARLAGARVINMSLGGTAMPQALQAAINRATQAGIVIVIAAGNDGGDNPDAFAGVAGTAAANNSVIIAGSVGTTDGISTFSDKAGTGANFFLTAVGEKIRAPDHTGTAYLWSGTSFAAPQISGAVALLAQAFPNLTGAQIVDLLLTTARDAGAPGADPVYGRGVMDLTRAFQPVGGTAVAGSTAAVGTASTGQTSAPMGDAKTSGMGAVILDGFERAFAIDLARGIGRQGPSRNLAGQLVSRNRQVAVAAGGTSVAVTLAPTPRGDVLLQPTRLTASDADTARAVAATVTQRLGRRTSFGFAMRGGAEGLAAQMAGQATPAFLVAPSGGLGFDSMADAATALRRQVGGWGVTAAIETGDVLSQREQATARAGWARSPYEKLSIGFDRQVGPVALTLTAARLAERDTLLGARLGAALGSPGATSWFADAAARFDAGDGWTVGGTMKQGWTSPQVRGFAGGGLIRSNAWSFDIGKDGLLGGDSWGLRLAQPLRVSGGGLDLTLPTQWDYTTRSVSVWTSQHLSLAPTGRELDLEMRYARPFAGGVIQTNLFWRREPGNWAALPADRGAALRWSKGF